MPRSTIIRLSAAVAAITLVLSVAMVNIDWFGKAASAEAKPIDTLLDVMIVISSFVFAVVMVAMVYSLWKYSAKPGDESDGEPIHGHTGVEIAWTTIPTIIVLFGAVYSAFVLADIEKHDKGRLVVKVTAEQFTWHFDYPKEGVKNSSTLHVPVGRQVEFQIGAKDVLHSFWVPEWRIKKDAVPGITTRAFVTPNRAGRYTLICTELCGLGHSTMRVPVVAQSPDAFERWASGQGGGAAGGSGGGGEVAGGEAGGEAGRKVFASQGCGSCHILKVGSGTGNVGPNLDKTLKGQSADFVRESILKPDAKLASGFAKGIMPSNYAEGIDAKDLDALVKFIADSVGAK